MIIGICNGFQALLNQVSFHTVTLKMQAVLVQPSSTMMPTNTWLRWLKHGLPTRTHHGFAGVKVGDIHAIPVSHGEGKFVVTAEEFAELRDNGQIFTQYVDF